MDGIPQETKELDRVMYQLYRLGCPRVIWFNSTVFLHMLVNLKTQIWVWEYGQCFFIYKKDPCYVYTKIYLVPLPTGPFWARTVAQVLAACILMVLWTPSLGIQEETASEWLGL